MLKQIAYRFRLRARPAHVERMRRWTAACRYTWNYFHAQREQILDILRRSPDLPEETRRAWHYTISYYSQSRQLTALKRHQPWLADCPAIALIQVLRDLDTAWQRFRAGLADRPRYKGRRSKRALTLSGARTFRLHDGARIIEPAKLGGMTMRGGRPPEGRPYRCTISEDAGHWNVSIGTDREVPTPTPPVGPPIGIDMGVAQSMTISDGRVYQLPSATPLEERRMRRLARRVSRRQRGSKRQARAQARLNRAKRHIADRVQDARHRITSDLAKSHSLIVIEDLRVRQMSASASGTVEDPGRRVAQKRGLNRSIQAEGWYETRRQLTYKCTWTGAQLRAVAPQRTSQRCSTCGHIDPESRRSQSHFECTRCGYAANADANASANILAIGTMALPAPSRKVTRGEEQAQSGRSIDPRTVSWSPVDATSEVVTPAVLPLAESETNAISHTVTVLVGPGAGAARKCLRKSTTRRAKSRELSQRAEITRGDGTLRLSGF